MRTVIEAFVPKIHKIFCVAAAKRLKSKSNSVGGGGNKCKTIYHIYNYFLSFLYFTSIIAFDAN